jgi:hypothetical protein
VAPAEDNVTVKINIAWCENDYQLDISLAEDRETYKRIIDRAAEMGLSHILFAPRNSDISSDQNNTDPWGWEQLLWFGYAAQSLFFFCVCVLDLWIHAAIVDVPDLPSLKRSSHWSLGLYPASV